MSLMPFPSLPNGNTYTVVAQTDTKAHPIAAGSRISFIFKGWIISYIVCMHHCLSIDALTDAGSPLPLGYVNKLS